MEGIHVMDEYLKKVRDDWDWDADHWYLRYRTDEVIDRLAADPASAFHPAVLAMIRERVGDLRGKDVLVPSGGDNHAVYALHLMGARVTSADLSPRQIELSEAIAKKRGWDIRFAVSNTMELEGIADAAYDFVYTSNGVHVWINDLAAMYRSVERVLRSGGGYVMYNVHPFQRPFDDDMDKLLRGIVQVRKPYGVSREHFHWRVQDLLNAMADAGLRIRQLRELNGVDGSFWFRQEDDEQPDPETMDKSRDWRVNPLAALPEWLAVYATKE